MNPFSELVPRMKVISAKTAEATGYKPITIPIDPLKEPKCFRNIEKDLQGTNSVWISSEGKTFSAARHESEMLQIQAESVSGQPNDKETATDLTFALHHGQPRLMNDNFHQHLHSESVSNDPAHGKIKRTIEILDELESHEPLAIETLVSEDERRGK